ncbi:hypothetical protein [Hymenobacter puniceus]
MLEQHVLGQYFLQIIDIDLLVELAHHAGLGFAGNPDFQLRIQVQMAGRFDTEAGYASSGNRQINDSSARETLLVHQDELFVDENKHVLSQPRFS